MVPLDVKVVGEAVKRREVEECDHLLKDELDSLMTALRPLMGDVQVSLFSRFPRLPLAHTCLRARMDGMPQVVWCGRPGACEEVTRRSWSWSAEERTAGRGPWRLVVCSGIAAGDDLKGVIKAPVNERDTRSGRLAVAVLLGRILGTQLRALCDRDRRQGAGVSEPELQKAALKAQDAEQERIGFELHDGVAQTLSTALQYLRAAGKEQQEPDGEARGLLARAESLVHQAILEVRAILRRLVPPRLKSVGLINALREELRYFQETSGCSVEFEGEALDLPEDVAQGLYRIATEALSNIRRQSGARQARLSVKLRGGSAVLEVADWGSGFDAGQVKWGTGLEGIRSRAEDLGGSFSLSTAPGRGTTVLVKVPVSVGEQEDDEYKE